MKSMLLRGSAATLVFLSIVACAMLLSLYYAPTAVQAQEDLKGEQSFAPEATFAGTGVGAIPDGGTGCAPSPGAARDITFNVTGISGAPSSVSVSVTFGSPNHTFMGDIVATLIAPNGANKTLFGRTGSTSATGFGDGTDLGGTYVFSDTAPAPPSGGWWQEATVRDSASAMTAGTYRTTDSGGAGAVNPMPATNLTAAFAGVANPNGTWTLRLTDGCSGDTGAVTAASLTLNGSTVIPQHVVDYDGDGKTDFSVVRNTGGGANGQLTWFNGINGSATYLAQQWGLAGDFIMAGDFDGDHKSDITVWRPGAQSNFYILQSSTNTFRTVPFGVTGDDPTVIGDYTGDGKWDPAVYRAGANSGDRSYWYYLASSGPLVNQVVVTQWGQNGDFVAPGDYSGDGKNDFCVQRNAGGGSAVFYEHNGSGGADVPGPTTATFFGTPTDVVVPGDYDGDGKTDIAVVRGIAGQYNWFYDPSSIDGVQAVTTIWGASATDFFVQGDYDGDGRTDTAVWRPSATPGQTSFYYLGSTVGVRAYQWGQNGDYPVANYNRH